MQTFLLFVIIGELTLFLILEAIGISLVTKRREKRENEGTLFEDSPLYFEDMIQKRGRNVTAKKTKAPTKRTKNVSVKPTAVTYKVPKSPKNEISASAKVRQPAQKRG